MKPIHVVTAVVCLAILATGLIADESDTWSKAVKSNAERGTLEARVENVRGDTGKWRDDALLQAAPAPAEKPGKLSLDDWADQLLEARVQPTSAGVDQESVADVCAFGKERFLLARMAHSAIVGGLKAGYTQVVDVDLKS